MIPLRNRRRAVPEPESGLSLEDLRIFHQLARSLTSSLDLDAILRAIVDNMERTVEADLWALLLVDSRRNDLYVACSAGRAQEALRDQRIPIGEGVAGWVVQHGETLILPETEADPRVTQSPFDEGGGLRSVIAMPLCGRESTLGAIEIINPRAEQLTDKAIAFLQILADFAAIAIENANAMARIQQLTITDDTTGLYNVRYLYTKLESELERSLPVSLAFLDLDRFKLVNDSYGHLIGSKLLARTGQRIHELHRPQDFCFRYGGDEFVILMPETDAATAADLMQELRQKLTTTVFPIQDGLSLCVDPSIGVATAPGDGVKMDDLIRAADRRMYAVKNSSH